MWLFLNLIFFIISGHSEQFPLSAVPTSYFPLWFIIFGHKFIFSRVGFPCESLRRGLWKWFWVCLCEVPRGFIGSGLIFMLNFYGTLCFQRMLKQHLLSCKLFCNVSLPRSHQEIEFIPPPSSPCPILGTPFLGLWLIEMQQKWHHITFKTEP